MEVDKSSNSNRNMLIHNADTFLILSDQERTERVEKLYDGCADIYDETCIEFGLQGANVGPVVLKQYLGDNIDAKILDVAAGTGGAGEVLKRLGFKDIDAIDISTKMLEKAKEKNIYCKLIAAPVNGNPTPGIAAGSYDAIICTHAFSFNQLLADALDEFTRIVKQNGLLCFTATKNFVSKKECGLMHKISDLIIERKIDLLLSKEIEYVKPDEDTVINGGIRRGYVFVCKVI